MTPLKETQQYHINLEIEELKQRRTKTLDLIRYIRECFSEQPLFRRQFNPEPQILPDTDVEMDTSSQKELLLEALESLRKALTPDPNNPEASLETARTINEEPIKPSEETNRPAGGRISAPIPIEEENLDQQNGNIVIEYITAPTEDNYATLVQVKIPDQNLPNGILTITARIPVPQLVEEQLREADK